MDKKLARQGEMLDIWKEQWMEAITTIAGSIRGLFEGFMQGGDEAMQGVKDFLKGIANAFITMVQGVIFAANAAGFAKAILSWGASLTTDLAWAAAALLGLEAAKGIISGLEKGGTATAGTPYIVGEKGQELFIPNQSGQVLSNKDTMKLLTGIGGSNPIVNNYFSVESDFISVMEKNMPLYNQRKYAKR